MQPQDIYVLDGAGGVLYAPSPLPGVRALSLSQCAPLFAHAFALRRAGACLHTHDAAAVMATLAQPGATEWRITHQEMIKGIAGHGFEDELVVPIIENTPREADLADSMAEAMRRYPRSSAILVRRHGCYVWGASWEAAKTQAECYHYLFDLSLRMRAQGLDPAAVPPRVAGIGAATSYGAAAAGAHAHAAGAAAGEPLAGPPAACCAPAPAPAPAPAADADAGGGGFHGAAGLAALNAAAPPSSAAAARVLPLHWPSVRALLLDIEGCTTPISFVTETLFPYAAAHAAEHVAAAWGSEELAADVRALAALSAADAAAGAPGAPRLAPAAALAAEAAEAAAAAPAAARAAAAAAVAEYVAALTAADRKAAPLKALQAHIWREGYARGSLRGAVYADVPPALEGWAAPAGAAGAAAGLGGRKAYIYSSGAREAQRALFASAVCVGDGEAGGAAPPPPPAPPRDLRPLLSGFFDIVSAGAKTAAASYASIALSLGVDARQVLFATDAIAEARAASAAGMQVVLTARPGNVPLPEGHGYAVVSSLLDVAAAAGGGGGDAQQQ